MKFKKFIENFFPAVNFDNFKNVELPSEFVFPEKSNSQNNNQEAEDHVKEIEDFNIILSWPPNVFLILYSLLDYTDKYRLIVSPQNHFSWKKTDNDIVINLTEEWSSFIDLPFDNNINKVTLALIQHLQNVFNQTNFDKCIYELFENKKFTNSLFYLVLSVDELFSDINFCDRNYDNNLRLMMFVRSSIYNSVNRLSDCHGKHGFVTLKSNVPQSGLTINNLTQNLTCIKPSVKPNNIINNTIKHNFDKKSYNILFLPWPTKIESSSFTSPTQNSFLEMDDYFDFFDYKPTKEVKVQGFLNSIISAIERVGSIDLIVFPECALSEKTYDNFKRILFECFAENAPSLLAGVYGDGDNNNQSKNSAKLAFIGETASFDVVEQMKHHRWFLDKTQIRNYNLGSALDSGKKWWENIDIGRRNLLTLHTTDGVKLCPLICEDLARQEPVAQAVRAVGPNLVVCLLLDGPQLSQRWPGKYAAVLSDDPGASVLSVTSLGMTLRSTGLGNPPSRGVALWSEPGKSSETLYVEEPDEEDNAIGIIIELEMKDEKIWTIDGRVKLKPILRKSYHSTIYSRYPKMNTNGLKLQLMNELKRRHK
jgi:predicted amidohydrolase